MSNFDFKEAQAYELEWQKDYIEKNFAVEYGGVFIKK